MKPLEGLKVLDLSKVLAGPLCGMILGDLGADVIKIEDPLKGDDSRYFPPFQNGISTFFLACNRNKRGITLDLKTEKGLHTFYQLVKEADIIIESFRTGVTEKLKINYETINSLNPQIIYCSISGYGRKGPRATHGGYDLLAQAVGGLMSITGTSPNQPPTRAGYSVSDISTGMNAANAVLAAVIKKLRTGKGELIEASLLQSQINFMSYYATMYYNDQTIPQPKGSSNPNFAPYQAFRTSDGYMIIGISNDKLWQRLSSLPIFLHLKTLENYQTNELRVKNREVLAREIEAVTQTCAKADLLQILEQAQVPCAPINNMEEVVNDPQVIANNLLVKMIHSEAGEFLAPAIPFTMKNTTIDYKLPPPQKGQHNWEVLQEFGLSKEEIKLLYSSEVM